MSGNGLSCSPLRPGLRCLNLLLLHFRHPELPQFQNKTPCPDGHQSSAYLVILTALDTITSCSSPIRKGDYTLSKQVSPYTQRLRRVPCLKVIVKRFTANCQAVFNNNFCFGFAQGVPLLSLMQEGNLTSDISQPPCFLINFKIFMLTTLRSCEK